MRRIVEDGIKQQVQLVSGSSSGVELVPLVLRDRVAVIISWRHHAEEGAFEGALAVF